MGAEEFQATVRASDGMSVIDLRGDVNGGAEAPLDAAYAEAATQGAGSLMLNFAGATYINSTGIAVIVGILARARKDGRKVLASGLTDHYRHIFEITRLADFMTLVPDQPSAVA